MRGKLLKEYLKTIFFSVIASVIISLIICYFIFFRNGNNLINDEVQGMIKDVEQQISVEFGRFVVNDEFLHQLKRYNSWIQIMDEYGIVHYSAYVPQEIPNEYSNFQLANSVQESNKILGYTLYTIELNSYSGYGVIIGFDSNVLSRYSIYIEGGSNTFFFKCLVIFLFTAIVVIIVATIFYSQKIMRPITAVLEDIAGISKGKCITQHDDQGIFENVFIQLNMLQDTLVQNDKLRMEWITNISHDVRTPLSTIRGYAEVIASEEYMLEREEVQEFAMEILKSEEILEGLIEDLKVSNDLIDANVVLKRERIDIVSLVHEVVVMLESLYKCKGAIHVAVMSELYVFCDRNLIKRSLFNIISNSFIHNKSDVLVNISIFEELEHIVIVIEDNGIGVKKEELQHLFDRYFRGGSSTEIQGTGLGLAIAKEAIVAHGGVIEVSNKEEKGIRFKISLERAIS